MSFTRGRRMGGFPKDGEMIDLPSRHTRDGWTEVATHTSVVLHGKQYRNMREWSRPCVICKSSFSAFESSGRADANSQFSNKTCTAHRGLLPAIERGFIVWSDTLKGIVPGAMCVSTEVPTAPNGELEMLRTVNATMKEELEGLYMQLRELREQQRPTSETIGFKPPPQPVVYELPPEPLTMAESTKRIQAALAAKNNAKMPWEGG
jgi:hypothetical protein